MALTLGLVDPARASGYRGLARAELGDAAGIDEATEALGVLVSRGNGRDAAGLMGNVALLRWLAEGPEVGLEVLREATAFSLARNLTYVSQITEGNMVDLLADVGKIDEALDISRRLEADAAASGDQYGLADAAGWIAYLVCERGDVEGAQPHADRALAAAQHQESIDLICGLARVAHVRAEAGELEGARSVLESILESPGAKGALFYGTRVAMMTRCAVRIGDATLAHRVLDGFEPRYSVYAAERMAALAEIALAEGRHAEAVDLFADAVSALDELGRHHERARALLGHGRALMHLGLSGAEGSLREAHRLFTLFGFGPRMAEAEALMTASGARAG
jgi:tetratricopeptide (TPR) repeat protein